MMPFHIMNMIKEKIQQYISKNAQVEFHDNVATFEVPILEIKKVVSGLYGHKNLSLKLITATDERKENGCFKIWYVFGVPKENIFIIPFIQLKNTTEFPSLSLVRHEVLNYERKIKTFFGLTPIGCHDQRPMLLHENWPMDIFPLRKNFNWQTKPKTASGTYHFQKVKGEGIYEVPVGPLRSGIIDPGHFRFSLAGERIELLEPRLGFTHKGSEKLFEALPLHEQILVSEKISGDRSFSHLLAFCQVLEKLIDTKVPERARYVRVIYAELERLANHFGDIGAIMLDTGFNFGGAQGARLRELVMQINESITGSRFLRGVNMVSGVAKDIDNKEKNKLSLELGRIHRDFSEVIRVAENSTSLLIRLKGTGILSLEIDKNYGVVGVAGKATGLENDTRVDYPYAAYDELLLDKVATERDGDVYARFRVRIKEAHASIKIIQEALGQLPEGYINIPNRSVVFKKNALAISMVEGWRGEIVYFVTTDADGNIDRVVPRDPSFINWAVLREAGFGNVLPDFPLINKSFNLSYSGNDL